MNTEKKSILFTIGVCLLGGIIILTIATYIVSLQGSHLAFINQTDLHFEVLNVTKEEEQTFRIEAEILNNNLEWTLEENGLQIGESMLDETETDEVRQLVEMIYGQTGESQGAQDSHITLSEISIDQNENVLEALSPYERQEISFIYELEYPESDLLSLVFYSNQLQHRDGETIRNIRTKTELIELDNLSDEE